MVNGKPDSVNSACRSRCGNVFVWETTSAGCKSYENESDYSAQKQCRENPQRHMRALAHQPPRRLVLLRELQRIRSALFNAAAFDPLRSRRCGRFLWIVTEFAGHGDDASTEEKQAASERASVRRISGKPV